MNVIVMKGWENGNFSARLKDLPNLLEFLFYGYALLSIYTTVFLSSDSISMMFEFVLNAI